MSVKDSLGVLRAPNFRWFFLSRFVNLTGSAMANLSLAFAVLAVHDSAGALGQVLAARTIPMVLFLLLGGVVADRFDRTLVLQVSNLTSAATQGLAAYLVISGGAEIWMLIALVAVNGTTSAASMPAMQGIVPQLVDRKDLQPANVLLSMSRGALTVLGPSIAAVLVVAVGPGWGLAIDAATWAVAALMLVKVRIPPMPAKDGPATSMLTELREGWSYFRGTTWLWVVVAAFGLLNAMQTGALQTLAPAYAKGTIGVRAWGFAESAEAVGMLLMTVVLLRATYRRPLRAGMLGMLGVVAPLLVLGLSMHTVPLVVAMAVAGMGIEVFSLAWSLVMMENVPGEMLSRAYSYDMLGSFVAMPVGQLIYGSLGEWFGAEDVFVTSAVVYGIVVLAALAVPAVRRLERAPTEPVEPAAEGATA